MVLCWYCGYPIHGYFDFVPLRFEIRDQEWIFQGPGFFHDNQGACLRSWLNHKIKNMQDSNEIRQLRENFHNYIQHVYKIKSPAPPALPKECLKAYGGMYEWDEWILQSRTDVLKKAWEMDYLIEMKSMKSQKVHVQNIENVPKYMTAPSNLPGETDILSMFISF